MMYLVVGGSTFGLSTAYALACRGHQVTVFDRFNVPVKDAASVDVNKVVRADYGTDVLYQNLALDAIEKFKVWNKDAVKRFGRPLYVECGAAYLTINPKMNAFEQDSLQNLTKAGKGDRITLLSPSSSKPGDWPRLSSARHSIPHGYYNAGAGFADSSLTIQYLSDLVRESGIPIITGLKGTFKRLLKRGSKVIGFEALDGSTYHGKVIIAAGSWTPSLLPEFQSLCTPVGQAVVQFNLDPETAATYNPSVFPVWFSDVTQYGYYGFPIPITAVLEYRDFFALHFPHLNTLDIHQTRVCWYADSWDGHFVVDAWAWFKFTPVLGDVIADIVEGRETLFKELFRWRSRPAVSLTTDSIRAVAKEEDLTAEAYRSGRLREKVLASTRTLSKL
ncbi:FAD dependent oxidoreductase [Chytridium lagenaria]|nr:FAD dependent oxidoreductase [Chytridium lagenaria]